MRKSSELRGQRGFTLMELMAVVVIIGIVASLAVYGTRRYLQSAKTAEAKNTVGIIARAVVATYERESPPSAVLLPGGSGAAVTHVFCTTATNSVPSGFVPRATKYQPSTVATSDFNAGSNTAGWQCLRFNMQDAIYYRYYYNQGGAYVATNNPAAPGANGFEAVAQGDLDGNSIYSYFARTGKLNAAANPQLIVATQLYVENETE